MAATEGIETVAIVSPDGALTATFAPSAGMICCSLCDRGQELLGQRRGLRAYAERGSTMGIPLLHPWANRLATDHYGHAPAGVTIPAGSPLVSHDANGLPIHGVIGSHLPWQLLEPATADLARVRARMCFEEASLLALFPYPHELELEASLRGSALTIATTLRAKSEQPVPIAFGHHPYLTLPGAPREQWRVELPVTSRMVLDGQMIPTGVSEAFSRPPFTLADSAWDDAFDGHREPALFAVAAAGRRIELEFLAGYPYSQVFAPPGEAVICFEPMTAPANALRSRTGLRLLAPGDEFHSAFRITVSTSD